MAFVVFAVISAVLAIYTISAIVYVKKINEEGKPIPRWASLFFTPYLKMASGSDTFPVIKSIVSPIGDEPISPSGSDGSHIPSSYKGSINNFSCSLIATVYNNLASSIDNMSIPSINSSQGNTNVLNNFCNLGQKFRDGGCVNDVFDPTKDKTYLSFCCNGDPTTCGTKGSQCILDKSRFSDMKNSFENFNDSSLTANEAAVMTFCSVGNSILSNGCVDDEYSPMKSPAFRKYCCNNSSDPQKCSQSSIECAIDSSDYSNKLYNFQNLSLQSVGSNSEAVKVFCESGQSIMDRGCTMKSPVSDDKFLELCCNNSSTGCGPNSLQCTFDTSSFLIEDYNMKDMAISSWVSNKDKIFQYCSLGYKLQENSCKVYDPTNSETFVSLCCNNSKTGCSSDKIECAIDSSAFSTNDYGMQNMEIIAVKANKPAITSYCDMGNSLHEKGCSQITPTDSSKFKQLCCNNSSNPEDCTKGTDCIFNSSDFSDMDWGLQNMQFSSVGSNVDYISKYCQMGETLLTSGCTQLSPIESEKFRQFCCNNSSTPSECNSDSFACTLKGSVFVNDDYNMNSMTVSSALSNSGTISNYCTNGIEIIVDGCETVKPINSPNFRSLCCNGRTDTSKCNDDSIGCLLDSSKFDNIVYGMSGMSLQSISSNVTAVKNMCDIGISLMTKGCNQTHPINSDVFRNFCCNGSTDPALCNSDSIDCVINSSSFSSMDYGMTGMSISSIDGTANIKTVTDYCTLGHQIIDKKCAQTFPINSNQYRTMCCNTDTNTTSCTDTALQCTLDTSSFLNTDYNMSNMTIAAVSSNTGTVSNYCHSGQSLISNGCKLSYPTNSSQFRSLCCNTDTSPSSCTDTALQCTLDTSRFANQDYNMTNMTIDSISSNTGTIADYCHAGQRLITNGCKMSRPTNSSQFNKFCCNNTSDPTKCTESALTCTLNSSLFMNQDYNMTNMTTSAVVSNQAVVTNYCNLGYDLISNGCNSISPYTANFTRLCCNGNTATCNPSSLRCIINGSNFSSADYNMTNMTINAVKSNVNTVTNYCTTGQQLITDKCSTNPINSSKYRQFCCNNTTDPTKCTSDSLKCTTDTSVFYNQDYIMNSITSSNIKYNQSMIIPYCTVGFGMMANGCNVATPYTSNFTRLCCAGNTATCDTDHISRT
ncbi:MAG: hypothetical protein PHG66_01890 [Candidatus Colwellbacteria bacterium]|nr:hypothetical protein [Candidatus Colwellbacteria bacterium]